MNIFDNLTNARHLLREIKLLRMLNSHINIVRFKGLLPPVDLENFNDLCLVFEYIDTDLQKLIYSNQYFTNLHIQFFLYQILCGVNYIHSTNIIHRDLKPSNILVNANCTLKLCDLGLARNSVNNPSPTTSNSVNSNSNSNNKHTNTALPNTVELHPSISKSSVTEDSHLPQAPARQRELTKHVVTRWYRAPELILLTYHYTTSIDMCKCAK